MLDSSTIQKLSAALPDQVVFSVVFDRGSDPDASYLDMTIKDSPGTDNVLEGMTFDAYCIDTDRPIFVDREPIDGFPEYTADVYSSYEPLPPELIGTGLIEFPENLDLVNWIINQRFEGKELFDELGNSLGKVTSGDVQRAIWELIDDEQSTGGLGSFSQARADKIVALAQASGEEFVPSFEYTTIFGEQVTGQMAVIFVPDSDGDGLPDNQIVIGEVELAKIGDRIFFDRNGNNQYDDGEGLDGVDVKLLADVDGDGTIEPDEVIDTATTSGDGMYMFEVIPGDYQVMVDTETLPPGYRNTFDPDSPAPPDNNNMSEVRLNPGENNPDQDFGYQAYDYGDAPDTYGTTNASSGARHLLSDGQTSGTPVLKLGAFVDTELDGQPLPDALGDDNNPIGEPDDEDGVTFSTLQAGEQASVTVNVTSIDTTGPVYLNAWIDFNGDGDFNDPGEQVFVDQPVVNGANVLTFDVPEDAVSEQITYARFRLSSQVGLGATGTAPDGEVEDYQVTIEPPAPPEPAKVGDRIFFDVNNNNQYDPGEGLNNVDVKLISDGQVIDTVTTSNDGMYMFNVAPGDYQIMVDTNTLEPGYRNTFDPDSPAPPDNNNMSDVTLAPGETNLEQDFGYQAYDYGDAPDTYGTTNASSGARHLLSNGQVGDTPILKLGNLVDTELNGQPTPDALGDDNNNLDDEDGVTFSTLQAGEQASVTVNVTNIGISGPVYLNAWIDFNGDGDFNDPGEQVFVDQPVANGANVLTFDVPEDAVSEQITYARFRLSSQVGLGATGTAPDGEVEDYAITIEPPEPAKLGDRVFYDIDQDGIQDEGEVGIAGVTVLLLDGDGNQLDSTTTDESGMYMFNNLAPGDYKVQFTQPDGFEFVSPFLVGNNPEIDSDADPNNSLMSGVITLNAGEFNNTIDAGFYRRTKPGIDIEKATNGQDADTPTGPEIPVGGTATFTYEVTNTGDVPLDNVEVIDDNGTPNDTSDDFAPDFVGGDTNNDGKLDVDEVWRYEATRTVTEGQYTNEAMVNGHAPNGTVVMDTDTSNHFGLELAKIGDFVWHDLDGDGLQGAGEPGIAGATVILLDANGNPLQTTTTDGSGMYMFNDLNPLLTYTVTFDTPTGFDSVSPRQVGNDPTIDSDGLTSDPITLSPGEFNNTIDAGFYQFGKIGDFVWNDLNRDGIQDPDEPGINGATVQLLNANGNVIATTTTGDDPNTPGTQTGYYEFGGLTPGVEYAVRFLNPAGLDGVSPRQVGNDPTLDSDGLTSDPIKLLSGQFNDTIDAGFFQLPARLGDFVWHDLDADGIQDAGEPGIAGATVQLLDVDGNVLRTTITNSNGFYRFANLDAGQYKVMFNTPTGFDQVSPRQVGNNPAIDSDGLMSDVVTLVPGQFNRTIDSGFYQFAKIGDFVWNDLNENGVQDPNEPGIDGATVKLLDANGNVIATTTTGDDPNTPGTQQGYYEFGGVTPGQPYQVMFVNPDGFSGVSPFQAGNNPNLDSDANPDNNLTSNPIIPLSGQFVNSIDGGFFQVPDIVIQKYTNGEDADTPTGPEILVGDTAIFTYKVLNTGETPLVDVVVVDDNGTPDDPSDDFEPIFVNGDNNGNGIFDPGEQWVWTASRTVTPGQYTNIAKVTATNPNNEGMVMDHDPSNHFGVLLPGTIGDFVWNDLNENGIQDPNEPGIAGATVKLLDGNGVFLADTVTDANGFYQFTDLNPGGYRVMFVNPDGFDGVSPFLSGFDNTVDSDANPNNNLTSGLINLANGETNNTIDAGFFRLPASLGDFVFEDLNANGIQDAGEQGIAGAGVLLLDVNGNVLDTTFTDGTGFYEFTDLDAGQYKVGFITPDGFDAVSPRQVGNNPAIDSDGPMSDIVTLDPGENDPTIDAGFYKFAKIGDFVFNDLDRDGIQDPNEPGIAGAEVKLLVADGDEFFEFKTTTTDATGFYHFNELNPELTYKVMFVNPTGFDGVSPRQVGNNRAIDSDGLMSDPIKLLSGQFNTTIDAGFFQAPATLGDFVFNDINANGIQDPGEQGIAGAEVLLQDPNGNTLATTTTNANGFYEFTNLTPGDYKVTFVQPDGFDGVSPFQAGNNPALDSDANPNNGLMSDVVTLGPDENNPTIDAGFFQTAGLGDFVFEDLNANGIQDAGESGIAGATVKLLRPDGTELGTTTTNGSGFYSFNGLTPGDYQVEFVNPGFDAVSPRQVGNNPAIDSDGLISDVVTLQGGEFNPTIDAGFYNFAKIGDFVFNDLNENGIQDPNEPGIAGAEVKLLVADGDEFFEFKTTTTDATGFYHFNELTPGETYKVMFNNPDGFEGVSPRQVGNNPAIDSDGPMSDPVVLSSGEFNTTIDAGFFQLIPNIEVEKYVRVDENPIALKKLVAVEPIFGVGMLGQAVCETEGKPVTMVFEYDPSTTFDTQQDPSKGEGLINNGLDDDGLSYIVITNESDITKVVNGEGDIFFSGNVAVGDQFTASIANAGTSFSSNTYFYFFDEQGGPLLQSARYHTSCSAPILLGDGIYSATLVGYEGQDSTGMVSLPLPTFEDANNAPGPETMVGTEVAFRYEVTNTGSSEISNVVLTDNRIADLTFVEGDTDGDGNLDTDETWIYSATETAGEGLITNIGTVTGLTASGQTTIATDVANYTGVDAPTGDIGTEGQFLCKLPDGTSNKAESMVFRYDPSLIFDTLQLSDGATGDNDKGGYDRVNNTLDDDSNIFIVVSDVSGATTSADALNGDVYFSGNVLEGDTFTANAVGGSFNNNTYFYFFDEQNGELLQSAYYHMSCSAPIRLGDGILSAELIGYDGIASNLISLPEPTEPVEPPTTSPGVELPQVDDPFDVNNIGETGDTTPGPVANVGDIVTFTYEVKNTGNVNLTINDLVDDNATPDDPSDDFTPIFVGEEGNGDEVFNPGETWYFQAKEVATRTGVNTNTIKVKATDDAGTEVHANDPANYIINPLNIEKLVAVEPIDGGLLGKDLCHDDLGLGKPEALIFQYNPGNTVDTNQDADKAEIHVDNGIDSDGTSFIIVTDENEAAKALNGDGKQFFRGNVDFGDLFTADETTDSFGSTTYIHFFDDANGGLLQTIEYHTSCSQPIQLADVIGNATLYGYDGDAVAGDSNLVTIPEPEFVDADDPTGPQAIVNTQVDFKFVVTNTGNTALSNVVVTDDNKTPDNPSDDFEPIFEGGDDNGNGLLDVDETWIYTASELAELGQQTNKATVTANLGEAELMDMDTANYEGIIPPAPEGDVCHTLGNPTAMTFTYNEGTDVLTGQDPSKAGVLTQNGVDADGVSFVVVTDENDITKVLNGEGKQFFRGDVALGESFQATEALDTFGSNTFIHFFEDETGGLLQSINYHTSCSQPIQLGDVVGNATLSEYFGENGQYDNPMIDPVNTVV